MARFKLTIEYAGTKYSGWQKQKTARTVQGEIERAIAVATSERSFEFQGSGRTDAGVHALEQVAHLELRQAIPPETLRRRINDELPSDINILTVDRTGARFHARHAAVARSYLYQIARRRSAFAKPFVWWIKEPLDIDRMREAASSFSGMHDFRSFSDADPDEQSTDVQVDEVVVGEAGDLILIRVTGSHFIWKMVRRMVGVVAEVGRGGMNPDNVDALLRSADSTPARLTAPASGLFLAKVFYEREQEVGPLVPAVVIGLRSAPAP
ncbi:MAG: tRNA pseudouridine(38-40) synthase TruA [Vicinamibacterales bacterium]